MWKMALVLILTALAILGARLAYDTSLVWSNLSAAIEHLSAPVPLNPPLMYAGIRG